MGVHMEPSTGSWNTFLVVKKTKQKKTQNKTAQKRMVLPLWAAISVRSKVLRALPPAKLGFDWLDLMQVLCRQPWLLWVHECNSMWKAFPNTLPQSLSFPFFLPSLPLCSLKLGRDTRDIPCRLNILSLILATFTNYLSLHWLLFSTKRCFFVRDWKWSRFIRVTINIEKAIWEHRHLAK